MLEIRYIEDTGKITAWAGSPDFEGGHLQAKVGEKIILIDCGNPDGSPSDYLIIDGALKRVKQPEPPLSTHLSIIDAIDVARPRPVRVKRVWEGKDYFYDCLVTESVKDQYVAGDIAVGDYVIVHFDNIGEQIVMAKVFNSW